MAPEALANPYAQLIGGGTVTVGLLLTGLPASSVLGELLAADRRTRLVVPLVAAGFGPVLLFAFGPSLPVATALLVVSGMGSSYLIGHDQLALAVVPEDVRRRAFTLLNAGSMVTRGLGFAAAGAIAEWLPVPVAIPVVASCGLAVVLGTGARLWRSQPATRWGSPVTAAG